MSALQKIKKEKHSKKLVRRTVEDVLDCTRKCTGFPFCCLDCSEEPVWKPKK